MDKEEYKKEIDEFMEIVNTNMNNQLNYFFKNDLYYHPGHICLNALLYTIISEINFTDATIDDFKNIMSEMILEIYEGLGDE